MKETMKKTVKKNTRGMNRRVVSATSSILENLEKRMLMSATITDWTFDNDTVAVNLSPAPSIGTGTANSIGMQTTGTYGTSGASGTGDASNVLVGAQNNGTTDYSSTGSAGDGNAWRVVGTSDGWSSNAALGSQGAQFLVGTVGYTGISLQLDLDASSGKPPSELQVQYTIDGSTWVNDPNIAIGVGSNGATDGVTVATNSTNPNIVNGTYFQWANNADALFWQNGLTATFPAAANNDANFGVRIVNAATGSAEFEVTGTGGTLTPFPAAGAGNYRFDNVMILGTQQTQTPATVTTNPSNQNVSAGQPVTFTAAASGNPAPTVQWFEGTPGSGTLIPGATSLSYTFTTSPTASDNGTTYYAEFTNTTTQTNVVDSTAATLNDTLTAPVVSIQPGSLVASVGAPVTFTASATGSPIPTATWQVSNNGGVSYTPVTNGSGGYTTSMTNTSTTGTTTLTFSPVSTQNGYKYEAVFSNSVASNINSSAATLTLGGTAFTAWNFSNGGALIAGQTILNPSPSLGTGTSLSLGMGSVGTYSVYPGDPAASFTLTVNDSSGSYTTGTIAAGTSAASIQTSLRALHTATTSGIVVTTSPTASAAAGVLLTGDAGATLYGTSASSTFFVALDGQATTGGLSSSQVTGSPDDSNLIASAETGSPNVDAANINAWRIVGTNGWNSNAPIGTQGAQFLTSTAGDTSISASFDLYATGQGEAKMQVEYTTDGSTWINVPASDLSIGSGDTNITVSSNSTSANTVQGGYFNISGGGSSNSWYNNLGVNLTGIAGVNNDANFGIRIVNAATGADCVNVSGAGLNNSSGNDRIGDVQILDNTPALPTVITNPVSQDVPAGTMVTFTAAALGYPTPTVQWQVSNNSGATFVNDTTDAGNTTGSLTVLASVANSGYEYRAVFTNTVGSVNSSVATLSAPPVVASQPTTQNASAGSTATFTATATGNPSPTVQWQSSVDGVTFSNISGATMSSYNSGTGITLATYNVSATSTDAGDYYRAVFINANGTATTNSAQLNVVGAAFAQWIFNGVVPETIETTLSDGSLISGAAGSGDAPLPSLTNNPYNSSTGLGDIAQTLGLFNDYTGVQVESGSDILHDQSVINPSFDPYGWRIRSNHTETGWSQLAPELTTDSAGDDPQGVLFRVNTTGYSDITLHFDWSGGGIADMQPQYSPDGGTTWINAGGILQNFSKDYPGITATTTPPGFTVALEGSAYPAAGQPNSPFNNPNFELRLVAAYDPNLPLISDGNSLLPTVHGQYADSGAGAQNAVQVLDVGGLPTSGANYFNVSGGTYQLSYGGQVTAAIAYNAAPATIQADLDALSTIGGAGGTVTVADYLITPNTTASANDDFLGITFGGSLGDKVISNLLVVNNTLTGNSPTATVATWVPGAAAAGIGANGYEVGVTRFLDSNAQTGANGGDWQLSDFSFNGLATSGAPTIVTQPASTTVIGGTSATFTAVDYTEATPVTAQWQINTGSGWSNISGATNFSVNTSTYTFTTNVNLSDSGHKFQVIFTNPNGSTTSFPATLTVVAPVAPSVTLQPAPDAVQVGNLAQFTATATGSPSPTVQWQVNSGSGWSNVSNSVYITGATTTTLSLITNSSQVGSSYQYRAVFTNLVSTATSNPATLTVLAAETVITDWNFATHPIAYDNSPAPSIGSGTATALGFTIPFDYAGQADGASGTGAPGAVNADDVTSTSGAANPSYTENTWRVRGGPSSTSGGAPANGWSNYAKEYTQGVEFDTSTVGYGGIYVTMDVYTTTSGELNARQQYTLDGINWYNLDDQHLAYNGSTNTATGLDDLDPSDPYAPLSLFSNDFYGATATYDTTNISSVSLTNNVVTVLDNNDYQAGQQVNVKGIASPNAALNGIFTITAATSTSFSYALTGANIAATAQTAAAASLGGFIVPLVFNLTGIAGVANNPNFGIRLVNAYNPSLPTISTTLIGDSGPTTHGQYAVASSIANPTPYPGSAGNWRFDNIVIHGVSLTPAWFNPGTSTYTWNGITQTLTVTAGTGTIVSDPLGTNSPIIVVSGSGTSLQIDSTAHVASINISGGASVTVNNNGSTSTLVVAAGSNTFAIDSSSSLNINSGFLDLQAANASAGAALLASVKGLISFPAGSTGIISSSSLGILGAIGSIENAGQYGTGGSISTTFGGVTPGPSDVLVRETYVGDSNLDGQVNSVDYTAIDYGYLSHLTGWVNGDFNGDGVINGSDYTLIDNAFNTQGTQLSPAAQIASPNSVFAGGNPLTTSPATQFASLSSITDLLKKDQSNIVASSQDVLDALNG